MTAGEARPVPRGRLAAGLCSSEDLPDPGSLLPLRPTAQSQQTAKETAKPRETAPAPDPGTRGPEDRPQPSNVLLPADLADRLREERTRLGYSNGEVILVALEATHERLQELISRPRVGGGLFGERQAGAVRRDGTLTPLNFRLPAGDFEVIDRLVGECGARSRSHLITVALTEYLKQT